MQVRYYTTHPTVLLRFTDLSSCSDLLSFHKEWKAGETDNYVSQHASIYDQPMLHTLSNLVDRMVELDNRIKVLLGNSPEKQAWEAYMAGYITFHLQSPRYQLKEILPEYCHEHRDLSFLMKSY